MSYRRWYDNDPKLSSVVHAMEFLNKDSQAYFAEKLLELSQSLMARQGGVAYLETLDERKKNAMGKARDKKRWYDWDDRMHLAFNNLYALPAIDRREVALKLATPIQIVEGYEKHCNSQGRKIEACIVEEILRSSFVEGQERTRKLYSLYLSDFVQPATTQAKDSGGLWGNLLKKLQETLA